MFKYIYMYACIWMYVCMYVYIYVHTHTYPSDPTLNRCPIAPLHKIHFAYCAYSLACVCVCEKQPVQAMWRQQPLRAPAAEEHV